MSKISVPVDGAKSADAKVCRKTAKLTVAP
jgi:hypothetical protein